VLTISSVSVNGFTAYVRTHDPRIRRILASLGLPFDALSGMIPGVIEAIGGVAQLGKREYAHGTGRVRVHIGGGGFSNVKPPGSARIRRSTGFGIRGQFANESF